MTGVGLIIPDVHEKIVKLKRLLKKYEGLVDWVVFLGDFFDSFDGLTQNTHDTAKWIVENIGNKKYTFLYGNHDIHYAYTIGGLMCSGYTGAKHDLMDRYINREHWDQFGLVKWVGEGDNEWLCTHAGLHPSLLHPLTGFDKASLAESEQRTLTRLTKGEVDAFIAPGRGRGGWAVAGGVDWLDWNSEFVPIAGLNQIVGHTQDKKVRWNKTPESRNVCIDTNLNHVILLDGTTITIQEEI